MNLSQTLSAFKAYNYGCEVAVMPKPVPLVEDGDEGDEGCPLFVVQFHKESVVKPGKFAVATGLFDPSGTISVKRMGRYLSAAVIEKIVTLDSPPTPTSGI